ncbi:MAG: translation elongation factor Ts [Clostridiales bacterium]|nr:translation elongation factor Ts [Clostridiales bacterium]
MANIDAKQVKELRDMTGCGIMDCKKALVETDGDIEKALKILREKGLAGAQKKASRIAADGLVETYCHMGGKIGVMLELNCETDFVAKTEQFHELAHNLAMHIAAYNPKYIRREDVPASEIENEKEIARTKALNDGKPEKIIERIVDGNIEKYFKAVCLLEQPWVMDDSMTVENAIKEVVVKTGENIQIRRFVRYEKGEGLQKREDNFADEVMKQAQQ